ncbi:Mediator of RNA polymerase II transcription subunit 8 [Teratosphaeria destructans]|uniref:Mediator of RNA polymerase II transcription subunit 8 n=1 Tax=Teratosphaeria destructans TaxID=418781 RepID=A0A9W7SND8_9PEZI|nr:Mediator of RNA polymerase II transcription subunit 8 [Teratosphaeria destructans]
MDEEADGIAKVLDRLRLELAQIQSSLETLMWYLDPSRPPPAWPDTVRQIEQSAKRLTDLQRLIASNRDFIRSLHVYPLTSFPGHDKGSILEQLLRKKLDPKAEDWIAEYSQPPHPQQINSDAHEDQKGRLQAEEYEGMWDWADGRVKEVMGAFVGEFDSDYTMAEREHGIADVKTGLKRRLRVDEMDLSDDEEEDGDEDGDQNMEVDVVHQEPGVDASLPPLQLDAVLKFMTTGRMPPER